MSEKKCRFCGEPLGFGLHGNRNYCSDVCYDFMKLLRNQANYQKDKSFKESFAKSDRILAMFHKTYGSTKSVPVSLLDSAGMDWLISKGEVMIEELPVKIIGIYGYNLSKNETVRIWMIPI